MLSLLAQRVIDLHSRVRVALSKRLRPKGAPMGAVVDLLRTNEQLRAEKHCYASN